jgi:molybdopterin molybdotransferase
MQEMAALSVSKALETVLAHTTPLGSEDVDLTDAVGRVLAEPITADADFPPFDRAAMDGYAVRAEDCTGAPVALPVTGEVRAGGLPEGPLHPGTAVAIMTGATVPQGATAVQMVEKTRSLDGGRRVEILEAVEPGTHIAFRGCEARAGEALLSPGLVLGPAAIGVLAASGHGRVKVGRRPTLAFAATGDELVDVWETPGRGQIRNSNGYAVEALARGAGAAVRLLGTVPDEPSRIAETVRRGFESDVLVLSGGVSAGAFDLVEDVLERFDVGLLFTRVAVKPGAPLVFGRRGDHLVFGLPGNPVSAQVTFDLFVRPALLKMQGATVVSRPTLRVELREGLRNRSGREAYVPARVRSEEGRLVAYPVKTAGSADLFAHARASALLILEPGRTQAEAGETLGALLLGGFLDSDFGVR